VALLAKFVGDRAKTDSAEPNAFTRDLLQQLIDEAQQRGGLSALSLAFVLRLLVTHAGLSSEALASVFVPMLPLSFNSSGTRMPVLNAHVIARDSLHPRPRVQMTTSMEGLLQWRPASQPSPVRLRTR
jgi:polyhydroxyalkanoate synthesis regulator protein